MLSASAVKVIARGLTMAKSEDFHANCFTFHMFQSTCQDDLIGRAPVKQCVSLGLAAARCTHRGPDGIESVQAPEAVHMC